jgi:aminomethyltransferase
LRTVTAERTPLYEEHVRLGAQMTNFGGWIMPLQYTSIREEHRAVREAVGLFDLSHMGELRVKDQSLAQHVLTRDLARLRPGRVQYTLICNEQGGIIDDVLAYAFADGGYFLVVNAGNQDRDFEWIRSHTPGGQGGGVFNVGREWALIGVQGPRAAGLVQRLTDVDLSGVKYYAFVEGTVAGVRSIISRTGYTGEDGFELFCANTDALRLWMALLEEGRADGIRPAGLGARDTLRLEAGMRPTAMIWTKARTRSRRGSPGRSRWTRSSSGATPSSRRATAAPTGSWSGSRCSIAASRGTGIPCRVRTAGRSGR